ncbi:MAG: ABC transporter permease [Nanoarchaeota archaeon]|nr:ABC transporter permease [Nanoarchaeota archaeon]
MNILKYWKLAFNILVHSKLRSWLAIIGIVIGVASVIAIMSLGQGMQQELESRLGTLGADIITISLGNDRASGPEGGFRAHRGGGEDDEDNAGSRQTSERTQANLTNREVQALKLVPNIKYIGGVVSGRGDMNYLSQTSGVSVQGVDTKVWKYMITTDLTSGRYLSQGDKNVIVIGSRVAEGMFKQDIQINRPVIIEGTPFRVVGILKASTGFGGSDRTVYMPIETARETLENIGDKKKYDSIVIKVNDANLLDDTETQINNKLMLVRAVTEEKKDFTVSSVKATQETISSMLSSMTLFLGAIAAISLIVGAIGIANTMFTTVLQKTKEIGIMKAVGAKNRTIMLIFLFNSAMIGLVGGILGGILGIILSSWVPIMLGAASIMPGRFGLTTLVTPELVGFVIGFSIFIGLVSGAVPAYRASRMNPVDALRYE